MKKRKLFLFLLFLTMTCGFILPGSKAFAEEMNPATEIEAVPDGEKAEEKETKAIEEKDVVGSDEVVSKEESISPKKNLAGESEGVVNPSDDSEEPAASSASDEEASEEQKDGEKADAKEEALEEKDATLEVSEEKEAQSVASDDSETKGIYLNGESGDDNNDGLTKDSPVASFQKVKELIEEEVNKAIKNIFVTGTTTVEGEISLEKKDAKLVRHKDFNGYLLKVIQGKTATLKDITIDGNSENNLNIEKSLIYVDGGTLNIEEGAILRNNKIKPDKGLNPTHGGAIDARNKATVNMSGGSVENNQATYGGGVHLENSIMYFTGGAVQNNRSDRVFDKPYNQYYSAGGGIILRKGSELNMSDDAKVLNNFAAEVGGGISVGSNNPEKGSVLNMNGGTVDGNVAGSSGGGIFIQAKYFSGTQGKAYITAGKITNNKMDGSGKTNMAFGGGGIYVNGATKTIRYKDENGVYQEATVYGANGELYLENVLITDNKSEEEGAGLASCPISKTTIYVNNGVAFDKNTAGKPGNDLFIYSNKDYGAHSGNANYKLSKRMLGGGLFNWTKPNGTALSDAEHEGTLVIPEGDKDAKFAVNSNPEDIGIAKALAKVIISGNYSKTRGGGIGSNGSIVIGTEKDTTEIEVEKQWDDNDNANKKRPNTIKVQLYAKVGDKDYLVETKELKAEEDWKAEFKDLPTLFEGAEVTYTIKEVAIGGYESKVTGDQAKGFIVTNKEKPEEPKTRDIKVTKRWDLVGSEKPVDKIDVELYRNGESTGKKLELNAGNNWSGEFKDLEIADKNTPAVEYRYTIKEVGERNGLIQFGSKEFEVSYSGDMEGGFILINKEKPERPPEEPPTPPTRDIRIVKKWDLVGNDKPVARIEIELYRDGKATGKVIELNESNNWSGSFTGLEVRDGRDPSRDYIYTVKERGENGGSLRLGDRDFDVSYEGSMDSGFVITNKEKPETPPETPPEEPEKPVEPGKPEEPETPRTPDVPKVPEKPEKPNKPGKPGAPQTGVGFDMGLWAGLASLSAAALGLIGTKKRRDEE